ncbi:putative transmembrane protein, partial [Toxoplasma gondii FOU]
CACLFCGMLFLCSSICRVKTCGARETVLKFVRSFLQTSRLCSFSSLVRTFPVLNYCCDFFRGRPPRRFLAVASRRHGASKLRRSPRCSAAFSSTVLPSTHSLCRILSSCFSLFPLPSNFCLFFPRFPVFVALLFLESSSKALVVCETVPQPASARRSTRHCVAKTSLPSFEAPVPLDALFGKVGGTAWTGANHTSLRTERPSQIHLSAQKHRVFECMQPSPRAHLYSHAPVG